MGFECKDSTIKNSEIKKRNVTPPGLIGFQNAQQQEVIDFEHYFNVTSRQL